MQQIDHIKLEEFPVTKDSISENITLKNNQQKFENSINNSEEEIEEIDNSSCFQKMCGKMSPAWMHF